MNGTRKTAATALLLCLAIALGAAATVTVIAAEKGQEEAKAAAGRWQHLALTHELKQDAGTGQIGRQINKLGRDGWQLVAVENFTNAGTTTKTVFYFKKPL